ncbi:N-Acetyl-gamma-glutamylphosphate reductase, partial [Hydrogenivirga sp. 128-5-R1-1]
MSIKVSIAGASGYTGIELLRVLILYKEIEIVQITSRQYAGKALKEVFPFFIKSPFEDLIFDESLDYTSADYYFLALPHEASLETVKKLLDNNKKVIDLSGAYRIKDVS